MDIEHAVNHAVVKAGWLRNFFDFYYTSFHFVVPLSVLGSTFRPGWHSVQWLAVGLAGTTLIMAMAVAQISVRPDDVPLMSRVLKPPTTRSYRPTSM